MTTMQDTSPLPTERLRDGGKDGRGSTFQWRCFHCRNLHLCLSLRCITEQSTSCAFSLSRFQARREFLT